MRAKNIVPMLIRMLEREVCTLLRNFQSHITRARLLRLQSIDLLIASVTFLHKLSIFAENKDDV